MVSAISVCRAGSFGKFSLFQNTFAGANISADCLTVFQAFPSLTFGILFFRW
jgi:hypothetical protein